MRVGRGERCGWEKGGKGVDERREGRKVWMGEGRERC